MRLLLLILLCIAAPAALAQNATRPLLPWPGDRAVPAPSMKMRGKMAVIPLPRPRPPEAGQGNAANAPADSEQATVATEPPPPSECFLALEAAGLATVTSLPALALANGCEAPDVLRLDAVMLADKRQITFNPPATLRCPMAAELVRWIREDLAPATSSIGSLTGIENGSFECRGRNRIATARLSEHGKANALDIGALLFNKKRVNLTDPMVAHDFRDKIRADACARFKTVLGPGSDGYHEEHIHLDLAERRNDYRICQWNVLDVPLPIPRPPEADIAWADAEKKGAEEAAAGKKP